MSERPPFSEEALAEAARLATERGAKVSILQLLKIFGTSLGLPHPALKPNRQEWQAAHDAVEEAERYLRGRGVVISGTHLAPTRNPAKLIVRQATRLGIDEIVMAGTDGGAVRNLFIANEPRRVARRAPMAVRLVGRR